MLVTQQASHNQHGCYSNAMRNQRRQSISMKLDSNIKNTIFFGYISLNLLPELEQDNWISPFRYRPFRKRTFRSRDISVLWLSGF